MVWKQQRSVEIAWWPKKQVSKSQWVKKGLGKLGGYNSKSNGKLPFEQKEKERKFWLKSIKSSYENFGSER